ncbi:TonB-dependent receptor plug domain-containing protein [Pseudoalteromonas denitrificans]|uniref:Iron complex outermembrane recepter protein n=1 Tax=Pseudoalteromonas denitrificans DSM 6059 TaxID=1123010 RepID=A0A1I1I1E3_9GAMM|nr:TonB-dependent receptor [Pseudoalteromonas denitrificans]SFC29855.1 iron complex outermembrane recepter protein [Pseudoalteromonas denitrificans DSM 6059]
MINNKLAKAVRLAIAFGAASTVALSANVSAAEEGAEEVERIEVTGSRIKRTDMEGASPVQIITAADMKMEGRFSVADVLRSSTSNSFGSTVPSSGGSWQSQASVDLLGVGASRTLVLLDGKRLPGSPTMGGSTANINQIPMAIVERIEILKDGGSAVYGSDAIAGVVNIILKKDYEGFSISANGSRPSDEGGDANDFSIVTGISSDKGNITFAYEHAEQKPIFDRDRPYTAPSIEDTDGNGILNYSSQVGISQYGASIINPNTGLYEASPQCDSLTANVDGFVGVMESDDHTETWCGFAYSGVSANQASTNRDSIFVNATYEVAEDTSVFARALFAHNRSFGRYAPAAAKWNSVPANSSNNPYDATTEGKFRWYQLGNRDGIVDDYSQDYILGMNGMIGDEIDYEIYYHHNTTDNKSVGDTYLSYGGLAYNAANGISLDTEAGQANMASTTLSIASNRFDQFYAGFSFEAGELAGGAIGHYFGGETFDIVYGDKYDGQSAADLVGGSSGNSAGASRDIWAVFYETILPVTDQIEVGFAVRYDDYSDFGTATTPKLSVTYRPSDDLMVRASYGEGFRAPSLSVLSAADSYAADYAVDYVYCNAQGIAFADCNQSQYDTTRQGNADLDAEESTTINLGLVWNVSDSFSVTADVFNLEIENAIRFVKIQEIVLMDMLGSTNPDPTKLTIDRTSASAPVYTTSTINGPGLDITGSNINLNYTLETGFGEFRFNSETSYFFSYKGDSYAGGPMQDQAGFSLQPEYRTQFTTNWTNDEHALTWNIDYIPSTSGFETPTPSGTLATNDSNESFMTHNVSYAYDAGEYGVYTLGVRNLTDEDPVLDTNGKYADEYDFMYSAGHIGRVYSLSGQWDF